ncbi:MAG: hypothetical protein WBG29_03115 [Candidatus Acidiferrales bacterium]
MTKRIISPKARAAGMSDRILRRTLALVERYQRRAGILQQRANAVTEKIRRNGVNGATPSQWLEDRDVLREDAQLLRIDARKMERMLRLVLGGRFIDAKRVLSSSLQSPLDCVSQILGPTVDRGLRKSKVMRG